MVTLSYNFNGGTNGNSITTSDTGSGDPLDIVSIGTGTTVQWDNSHPEEGPLGGKFASAATSTTGYIGWTTSVGSLTRMFGRAYYFQTATPTVSQVIVRALGAATQKFRLYVNSSSKLVLGDTTNGTVQTSTNTVPSNQQIRVEWNIQSGASATYEVRYYASADSDTITETMSGSAQNFSASNFDEVRFGIGANFANAGPYWLDAININDFGFPGPVQKVTYPPIVETGSTSFFWVNVPILRSSLVDAVVASTTTPQPIVVIPQLQRTRFILPARLIRSSIQDFGTPVTPQPIVVTPDYGMSAPRSVVIVRAPDPSQYLATPVTPSPIVSFPHYRVDVPGYVAIVRPPDPSEYLSSPVTPMPIVAGSNNVPGYTPGPVIIRSTLIDPVIVTQPTPGPMVVSPMWRPGSTGYFASLQAPFIQPILFTPQPIVVSPYQQPGVVPTPVVMRASIQDFATPVTPSPMVFSSPHRIDAPQSVVIVRAPDPSEYQPTPVTPSPIVVTTSNRVDSQQFVVLSRAPDPSEYLATPVTAMPLVVTTSNRVDPPRSIVIVRAPDPSQYLATPVTPAPIVVTTSNRVDPPRSIVIARAPDPSSYLATPVTPMPVVVSPAYPMTFVGGLASILRTSLQDYTQPRPIVVSQATAAFFTNTAIIVKPTSRFAIVGFPTPQPIVSQWSTALDRRSIRSIASIIASPGRERDFNVSDGAISSKWVFDRTTVPQVFGSPVVAGIPTIKWDIGTGIPLITLSSATLEYVRIPVTATSAGVYINPTSDVVNMAFLTSSTATPTSGDWKAAVWDVAVNPPATYVIQCLVGPGGTVNLPVGTYYVWTRIIDNPEIVVRFVGTLVIV